ncbi:hypothetical protein DFR33_102116 [Bradymonas sediminis]|uniref:Uncharacterized protein n=1 Tax=Bradymonas sediminis TaxID=1548548 RepID=A0A2Z4FL84_9DELT|nr:hypothetical protein DN745_10630 [Bradymonas sediminis]TDP76485.1 hypothetical protein DFR33_102116 [Bradymonas sediminis]
MTAIVILLTKKGPAGPFLYSTLYISGARCEASVHPKTQPSPASTCTPIHDSTSTMTSSPFFPPTTIVGPGRRAG